MNKNETNKKTNETNNNKALQAANRRLELALEAADDCELFTPSWVKAATAVAVAEKEVRRLRQQEADRRQQQKDAALRRALAADARSWKEGTKLGALLPQLRSL